MDFAKIIPMAIVMIAGPQILSAIFLATTEEWRRNSLAYVAGAALSITAIVSIAYFLGVGATSGDSSSDTLYIIVLILLVIVALRTFLEPRGVGAAEVDGPTRGSEPRLLVQARIPAARSLSDRHPHLLAVGGFLANGGEPWYHLLPFLATTLLLLALPALMVFSFGARAQAFLPKVRDWMNDNSWVVSEVVIIFFIAITIDSLVG